MPIQNVISDTKVPVKCWLPVESIEESALVQIRNTANLPEVVKHMSLMPDCHMGYGAPVGSVVAMQGAISPSIIGVDIGCGMMAVKTPLDPDKVIAHAKEIRHSIERSIPVGRNEHKELSDEVMHGSHGVIPMTDYHSVLPRWLGDYKDKERICHKIRHQAGTLGSGNHFVEVSLDQDRNVWAMLHSGSRHIGSRTAEYYLDKAEELMERYFITLPDPYLAYIPQGEQLFDDYMHDLLWCQEYAFFNRQEMMRRALRELAYMANDNKDFERLVEVNCHHNFAAIENHFGQNMIVARKGATRARKDELGIIPGSMGAKSFIVKGKGEAQSFNSSSHGAGRRMGRKEATRQFTVEDLEKQMEGIEARKDKGVLDEIPGAYKSIDEVMKNQEDLVESVYELKQIISIKGGDGPSI